MKYRCIIVDDEEMILERLERILDKHQTDFELVGKAFSGAEGVDLALETKPDIVLTDIVMPGLNGIGMIERLRPELPHTEFVILSAYSDFEYAKQAMRLNVQEYAVKVPLSEVEVVEALRRTVRRIEAQRARQSEVQKLVRHRLENMYRIRRQLIGEWIRGDWTSKQTAGLAESMNVEADLIDGYCCALLEWVDASVFLRAYSAQDQGTIRYGMLNVAEETIREQARGFACEWSDERILLVIAWPNMNSAADMLAKSLKLGQALIHNIRSFLKQNVHVSISERHRGWESLPSAFREASSLVSHGYYAETGSVFTRATVPWIKETSDERLADGFDRLFNVLLEEPSYSHLLAMAEPLKEAAIRERLPRKRMEAMIGEFAAKVRRESAARKKAVGVWPELSAAGMTFESQWNVLLAAVRLFLELPSESGKQEIVKAKQYIEVHLAERLTLDDVASAVNLAPTYFSTLFKKENGESFVDYVNRRKIERAAALLKTREYSNSQLCAMVGIQSEKYLCTLFKLMYGMPPQKFRKTIRQDGQVIR